jgi:hypothetical protein
VPTEKFALAPGHAWPARKHVRGGVTRTPHFPEENWASLSQTSPVYVEEIPRTSSHVRIPARKLELKHDYVGSTFLVMLVRLGARIGTQKGSVQMVPFNTQGVLRRVHVAKAT